MDGDRGPLVPPGHKGPKAGLSLLGNEFDPQIQISQARSLKKNNE